MNLVQMLLILAAACCMFLPAIRHPEWRGGLVATGCVFLAVAAHECEYLWKGLLPESLDDPELVPIALLLAAAAACAWFCRRSTLVGFRAIAKNRRFPILVWGLLFVTVLANVAQSKRLWRMVLEGDEATHDVREAAQGAAKTVGYALLLNWALLFLKDKRIVLHRPPSPHEYLLWCNPLVPVGRGSRRQAYKIGDTGFCAKFYLPPEDCVKGKMKGSVRREIAWRRFSRFWNSSSQEVYMYGRLRHSLPPEILECLPPVCERVFHYRYGWGVLETYYENPDGTAVIPYRREISRLQDDGFKTAIYLRVRDILLQLIANAVPFHEPGNLHVYKKPDGGFDLRLVDFEPDSKTLLPLDAIFPAYRRAQLRRKSIRFLAMLRKRYGVKVKVETEIG